MRLLSLSLISLIILGSCGGDNHEENTEETTDTSTMVTEVTEEPEIINSILIEPYHVGIFSIGQIVPTLPEELKSRKGNLTVSDEGEETTYELCIIFNNLEDLVDLQLEENANLHYEDKTVTEMIVHSNYYETSAGIHVGSTIQDFIEAYPDYTIWYTYISDRYVMETPALENVQFMLDGNDYLKQPKGDSDMEILDQANFAGDADIKSIRVY